MNRILNYQINCHACCACFESRYNENKLCSGCPYYDQEVIQLFQFNAETLTERWIEAAEMKEIVDND